MPSFSFMEDSNNDYPQIYSAPTVDTLGDASFYTTTAKDQPQMKLMKRKKTDKEFQIHQDSMHVSVKNIAISQRSAFSTRKPPVLVKDIQQGNLSPSGNHLLMIERLQKITNIRQLAFSPSIGRAADVLAPFADAASAATASQRNKRDGRYRPIHPVQATLEGLPPCPPLLSNKKHRLPLRVDVGFPNPLPEEYTQKQDEIKNETEWEEASPRLIVLVTSDDLGVALSSQNVGGPELQRQKQVNNRHFGRKEVSLRDSNLRYSMLAPPLDATHSQTLRWRPRAFHDRQPGMQYSMVCPLTVNLNSSVKEPLLASLSMYSLKEECSGKASEDFYFPAGEWPHEYSNQTQKAIFSHDPLLFSQNDLYIVLQIYKASHADLSAAYLNDSTSKETKKATQRAKATWDNFGTQFLSPLCFGIIPLFNSKEENKGNTKWPSGHTQKSMQLYAYSKTFESSTEFVARLEKTRKKQQEWANFEHFESALTEDLNTVSEEGSSVASSAATQAKNKKKVSMKRLLSGGKLSSLASSSAVPKVVQQPATASSNTNKQAIEESIEDTTQIPGQVTIFSSNLQNDFLESMLYTPPELLKSKLSAPSEVLVDASGEAAIMFDRPSNSHSLPQQAHKRSDLTRTVLTSSLKRKKNIWLDQREVLSLPPRPSPKVYDAPPSYRSLFNLLYLYPRILKSTIAGNKDPSRNYTVRTRLLLAQDDSLIPLESWHNPAPWSGPSLLKSIYTKISPLAKLPLNFKDELKLRLPMTLDGSFVLHFSLFSVRMEDDDLSTQLLAETTIPLLAEVNGNMVIIPNGVHRLKLGDSFQFQVETRLLSSVHVPDPEVALALSNPLSSQNKIANASGSVLASHFPPLLWTFLNHFVQHRKSQQVQQKDENKRIDTMTHFLDVCQQIKGFLNSKTRFRAFVKGVIDIFDESCLHSSSGEMENKAVEDDSLSEVQFEPAYPDPVPTNEYDDEEDNFDGGAVRKRKPMELEIRLTRTFSEVKPAGPKTPFSRVAYGASKTDRMRLEAELTTNASFYTNDNKSYMVDDDETVVTTEIRMIDVREAFEKTKQKFVAAKSNNYALAPTPKKSESTISGTKSNQINDFTSYAKSLGELGITLPQRARTAAQIMLAPCGAVGPGGLQSNLASLFSDKIGPDFLNSGDVSITGGGDESIHKNSSNDAVDQVLYSPGSDIEEDGDDVISNSGESSYYTSEGTFRSPWHCQVLYFSISQKTEQNLPVGIGTFLYESLLVLWLQAWMKDPQHVPSVDNSSPRLPYSQLIPSFDDNNDISLYKKFYYQLDILIPLCFKSIVLRYAKTIPDPTSQIARVIVDQGHMNVFESFMEMLALSLMGQAMIGKTDSLSPGVTLSLDYILDFLVGLCTVFHPAHMDVLIRKFLEVLRNCDEVQLENKSQILWSDITITRAKCSRRLRLRVIERLAVLPNFIALNYPRRLLDASNKSNNKSKASSSWTLQYQETIASSATPSGDYLNSCDDLLPKSGWLAELLADECLSICAFSCEAIVAEAMAQIDSSQQKDTTPSKTLKTSSLNRRDLLLFQNIAIHAITCLYELLLRRHAMDRRFQREISRERIAGLFTKPIFEKSLASVRWLARLESTHKVRSLWSLCLVCILQEAPENLIRQAVRSYTDPKNLRIHRFIRLLRLSSSTFQSFIDQPRQCIFPSEIDSAISPWLLQESFNTMCATIIIVVEECVIPLSTFPREQKTIVMGILDLLLHVLTTPQSCVTHLRAVGGAIQALESFGIEIFVEASATSLQHWIRIILGLMNSIALSVRSIAVDFVISLLGLTFDSLGNIDELALIFATVLPEVAAREIALHSVSGHIRDLEDAEQAVWPLRRSFADIEDANPLDDDRVDPQLSPVLSVFCRACQAVIDGVLIEMRLKGKTCIIVGSELKEQPAGLYTFDAEEESLFEAASFFVPETAPIQRIRWLMTLKSLHEAKGQWIEAAESLIMCAKTISDSIPHLGYIWRPSRFALWSDSRRSLWLTTVGQDDCDPKKSNGQVMAFANQFLESDQFDKMDKKSPSLKLAQLTVSGMCALLTILTKEAVSLYLREDGMNSLAYTRLESLLKILMAILDDHGIIDSGKVRTRLGRNLFHKQHVEEEASLRKVIASISFDMTKLAERLLFIVEDKSTSQSSTKSMTVEVSSNEHQRRPYFVQVLLSGKKPTRFLESTTLPTFLEWNTPCICRVPKGIVDFIFSSVSSTKEIDQLEESMCAAYGKPILDALRRDDKTASIVFAAGNTRMAHQKEHSTENEIRLAIGFVEMEVSEFHDNITTKHFVYQKPTDSVDDKASSTTLVKMTVANPFPCPLSRQRTLLTTELMSK